MLLPGASTAVTGACPCPLGGIKSRPCPQGGGLAVLAGSEHPTEPQQEGPQHLEHPVTPGSWWGLRATGTETLQGGHS